MKFSGYTVTTAPASAVVKLSTLKLHCRVDTNDDDEYIIGLEAAAVKLCQNISGRSFITQTITATFSDWPQYEDAFRQFELPRPAAQSITSVKYYDVDNVLQTLSDSLYSLEAEQEVPVITFKSSASLPSLTVDRKQAIQVEFLSGYGASSDDVDDMATQAVMLLVRHFYEIRQPVLENMNATKVPLSVGTLLKLLRVRSL